MKDINYMAMPGIKYDVTCIDSMTKFFCKRVNVIFETIQRKDRSTNIKNIRFAYYAFLYMHGFSLTVIAHKIGVTHASVINGLKRCTDALENKLYYPELYNLLHKYNIVIKYEPGKNYKKRL